jgi:hypothetical protein
MCGDFRRRRLQIDFAERNVMECGPRPPLLRLDADGLDHFGPFLGFVGDELAEVGGRTDERCATQIGKPRLDLMIGESGVDLLVESLDDLGRRGLRCADAGPGAGLVARHELADGWRVR